MHHRPSEFVSKKTNAKHVLTLQLTEISKRSKNQVDYN